VLIALTADHGFLNVPEYSATQAFLACVSIPGTDGRSHEQLAGALRAGIYAAQLSYPTIHLDYKLIDANSLDRAEVESAAARILTEHPAIAAVYTAHNWRAAR